jgi:hypothetical protein
MMFRSCRAVETESQPEEAEPVAFLLRRVWLKPELSIALSLALFRSLSCTVLHLLLSLQKLKNVTRTRSYFATLYRSPRRSQLGPRPLRSSGRSVDAVSWGAVQSTWLQKHDHELRLSLSLPHSHTHSAPHHYHHHHTTPHSHQLTLHPILLLPFPRLPLTVRHSSHAAAEDYDSFNKRYADFFAGAQDLFELRQSSPPSAFSPSLQSAHSRPTGKQSAVSTTASPTIWSLPSRVSLFPLSLYLPLHSPTSQRKHTAPREEARINSGMDRILGHGSVWGAEGGGWDGVSLQRDTRNVGIGRGELGGSLAEGGRGGEGGRSSHWAEEGCRATGCGAGSPEAFLTATARQPQPRKPCNTHPNRRRTAR